LPRRQATEDDVVSQAAIDPFADRFDLADRTTHVDAPQMIYRSSDDHIFDY
jgi:hypothetical protein